MLLLPPLSNTPLNYHIYLYIIYYYLLYIIIYCILLYNREIKSTPWPWPWACNVFENLNQRRNLYRRVYQLVSDNYICFDSPIGILKIFSETIFSRFSGRRFWELKRVVSNCPTWTFVANSGQSVLYLLVNFLPIHKTFGILALCTRVYRSLNVG